jgi:hypothetical protein
VVRTLNEVAPYDWAKLLHERVDETSTHAPLGGIERGGWKLVYNDKPNLFAKRGATGASPPAFRTRSDSPLGRRWQDRRRPRWIAGIPVWPGTGHEAGCGQWPEVDA